MNEEFDLAMKKAIGYLSLRDATSAKMLQYLVSKEFSESISNEVIEVLKGYGYIDDEKYAKMLIEKSITGQKKGKRAAMNRLYSAKIPEAILKNAISEIDEEQETQNAIMWVDKLLPKMNGTPYEIKQKLYRRLISKGFTHDTLDSAMRHATKLLEEQGD